MLQWGHWDTCDDWWRYFGGFLPGFFADEGLMRESVFTKLGGSLFRWDCLTTDQTGNVCFDNLPLQLYQSLLIWCSRETTRLASLVLVPIKHHSLLLLSASPYRTQTRSPLDEVGSTFNCTHLSSGTDATSMERLGLIAVPHVQIRGQKKKVGGGELHSVNPTCMVNELEIIKAYVVIININGFACCACTVPSSSIVHMCVCVYLGSRWDGSSCLRYN